MEKVTIQITAKDEASAVLRKTEDATDDLADAVKDLNKTNTDSFKNNWTELKSKLELVSEAFRVVYEAAKQLIGEYSNYVESVDKMSMATGMAADQTSRLIQLADDFRVEQKSLETAMKMALQNGFEPTVENLAKLSDEYLNITSATERAEKMQAIFGRQWIEMVPLLERGGQAIRSAAAGIGDGLVVTEQAIEDNRKFQKSVDDLTDSWTSYKYSLTKDAIPALAEFLSMEAKLIEVSKEGKTHREWLTEVTRIRALADYEASAAAQAYGGRLQEQADAFKAAGLGAKELTSAEEELTAAGEDLTAQTNLARAALSEFNLQLLYQQASAGLSSEAALALASSLGLVDERSMYAAQRIATLKADLDAGKITAAEYTLRVKELGAALGALQDRRVTLTLDIVESGTTARRFGGEVADDIGRASGGPVLPGETYSVGEDGPETLVMGQSGGYVIPNVTNNAYNLTIHEAGQRGNVVSDFALLRSLAGGIA